jgi:hypothetical protein
VQKTITHYPSRENFQRSQDRVVPLRWAVGYLTQLLASVPKDEQDTAEMTWPVKISYRHTLSAIEVAEDRRQRALAWLAELPASGADAEAIARLRAILGA